MKTIFTFLFLSMSLLVTAQDVSVENPKFPQPSLSDWAADNLVLDFEPVGQMYGVQKADGTIYLAVNDTLSTANLGLVILTSNNNGESWSMFPSGITYRGYYDKIKLLRSGLDSVYCFFQIGPSIYSWNFLSGNLNQFPFVGYRSFDVVASSTGNLYMFLDSLATNNILRYGSINGGANWGGRGNVTSAGANPIMCMSGTGDTLIMNYYGPILADTSTSVIRQARYRESGVGTLASVAFIDVATETTNKTEYLSAMNNGESWFVYTSGPTGARDIWARKSINNGLSYDPAVQLAANVNTDEYWFDIRHFSDGAGNGFDFIYYSDSLQAGSGTVQSDQLFYSSVPYGSATFSSVERINDNPMVYSNNMYAPKIIGINVPVRDVSAVYVGETGANKKIYLDKLSRIVPVELTSFNALVSGKNVQLKWTTASEKNNSGFEVQKKVNGTWSKIGFVTGNGTTSENKTYSYTDENLLQGKYSYRLKQIDYNGTYEYSDIVEAEVSIPEVYSLEQNYPNPFNPATIIKYSLADESSVKLFIYNSIGEKVDELVHRTQSSGSYEINFDGGNLSSGVYFYSLEANSLNGKTNFKSMKKMILVK
ncbi:MAG: T9SS type A sorting domain-containing protein [Ignavibacteriales bacterium]|nr:MAG: T9SS type A sorting domain-containing protein [Ignavibacteriales bacterium]